MSEFLVRFAEKNDFDSLSDFFTKAYGPHTIFKSHPFLSWFLTGSNETIDSVIAVDRSSNQIAAHYGTIKSHILFGQDMISVAWGVSAYTLESYRGKGLGKQLLQPLLEKFPAFAVFGFSPKTAQFYRDLGFFVPESRARTYAKIFNENVFAIAELMHVSALAKKLLKISPTDDRTVSHMIKPITYFSKDFQHCTPDIVTSGRTKDFMNWRYFSFPVPKHEIYGIQDSKGQISSYLAMRQIILQPENHTASRILDVYGKKDEVEALLTFAAQKSRKRGDVYIDFSVVGKPYEQEFIETGFTLLEEDDTEVIPQRISPVVKKCNHEYLGLYSRDKESRFNNLSLSQLYFPRMESDRDRLNHIAQVTSINL